MQRWKKCLICSSLALAAMYLVEWHVSRQRLVADMTRLKKLNVVFAEAAVGLEGMDGIRSSGELGTVYVRAPMFFSPVVLSNGFSAWLRRQGPAGVDLESQNARLDHDDFVALGRIHSVRNLLMNGEDTDDDAVMQLGGLRKLVFLALRDAKISDESLTIVGELPKLDFLDLTRTKITDAGLKHLETLHQLRAVDLTDTQTTHEGAMQLLDSLPHAHAWVIDVNGEILSRDN